MRPVATHERDGNHSFVKMADVRATSYALAAAEARQYQARRVTGMKK